MQSRRQITPEILGQLIPAAWLVVVGDPNLPSPDVLRDILIRHSDDIPDEVVAALHVDIRPGGPVIVEQTDIVAGGQQGGLWRRMNPDGRTEIAGTEFLHATTRLNAIALDYPDVVRWIKERLRQHKRAAAQERQISAA